MAEAGIGFVDIVPRTTNFASSLVTQMRGAIGQVQAQTQSSFLGLTKGAQAAFVGLGVLAVAAITKGITATQEWAAQVRALQRVTGQSAESASGFAAAAAALGIGVDKLSVGFGLLAKNIVNGAPNLVKYGIAVKDTQGALLPFDDVLGNVIDKFQTLPKGPAQAAFAMNVFGRSGRNLIPILSRGRDGLAALREEAEKAGLILSQDTLDATKELGIAQRELGESVKGAAIAFGKEFIPIATAFVKVVTAVVQVVSKIPSPVLAGVAAFTALTGAVAAINLIGGFFIKTWTSVLTALGLTAGAEAAVTASAVPATVALEAEQAAALALQASAERLAVILGVQVPAAQAATTASSTAATEALIAEANAAQVAAASTAGAVGKVGLLAGALKFLRAAAIPLAGGFLIGSIPELPKADDLKKIDDLLGTLQQGIRDAGGAANLTADQQGFLAEQTKFAASALGANAQAFDLALKSGISYSDALAEITGRLSGAASSTTQLSAGIRELLGGIEDVQTPIKDIAFLVDTLSQSAGKAGGAFKELSERSGQDFSAIGDGIQQALLDPKTTVEDLPGIFAGALGKVRETMQAWHDQVVDNFGGAQQAISEFLGQDKVSFSSLTKSLADTRAQLRRWSSDFSTIMRESGGKAQRFLQDMSANGLESIGILDAVADQPKKIRDGFLAQYNEVNKATSNVATQITDAFGKAVDRIILQLKNIIRAIQGLPPIVPKVDNRQALAALDAIIARQRQAFQEGASGGSGSGGPVNPHQVAAGGIIHGAAGFITQGPVFQFGEGGSQTFAGKGAEAVIPLNDRGIAILSTALARAQKNQHIHITIGFDESGNIQVRKIARDEIDREHDYRVRVGG